MLLLLLTGGLLLTLVCTGDISGVLLRLLRGKDLPDVLLTLLVRALVGLVFLRLLLESDASGLQLGLLDGLLLGLRPRGLMLMLCLVGLTLLQLWTGWTGILLQF